MTLAALPIDDWQFWVVSILAVIAAIVVARMILPPQLLPKRLRPSRGQKRATLTVDGKTVGRKPDA